MNQILKLKVIETPSATFICRHSDDNDWSGSSSLLTYLFDGKNPSTTWKSNWIKVDKTPTKISYFEPPQKINHRWVLIDPSLASNKIPKELSYTSCKEWDDEDGHHSEWNSEISHLSSLYKLEYDETEEKEVIVYFEITDIIIFDQEVNCNGLKLPTKVCLDTTIKYNLVDQITVPDLMIHTRPCKLTSQQTYNIIRCFVKENINHDWAKITSDYDFCFTVKKKIKLTEAEKFNVTVVSFCKNKKSRTESRFRSDREAEIFEMTYSPYCYKDYTPIIPFEGKDLEDL